MVILKFFGYFLLFHFMLFLFIFVYLILSYFGYSNFLKLFYVFLAIVKLFHFRLLTTIISYF
jgi:hypothetical protein